MNKLDANIPLFEEFDPSGESTNAPKLKGMLVNVYRNSVFGDTTSGGVTSKYDKFIVVGEGIPGIFSIDENQPYLELKKYKDYLYCIPVNPDGTQIKDGVGPMFGGNFIYTSDSRFPNKYPTPVHDRFEHQR